MHVECTKRERRMSILLSDEEQLIVDRYLEKYKITNKSRWLRETILMFIHKNMEEDYPTLFVLSQQYTEYFQDLRSILLTVQH